jgi:hypothetical protein
LRYEKEFDRGAGHRVANLLQFRSLNAMDSQPPKVRTRRGFRALGVISLIFAIGFLPAPLAVLYELNDECLRTTTWSAVGADSGTLWRIPPLPVSRGVYLLVRTAVLVALPVSLLLAGAAIASFRSRAWSIRLHSLYAALQAVLMIVLVIAASRFSSTLDVTTSGHDWVMHLPYHSNVRTVATLIAIPGIVFPILLAVAFWIYNRSQTPRRSRLGR